MTLADLLARPGTLMPITRWGTPVMHTATEPVTSFDDDLHQLVADMFTTMDAAQGVGLAATQVGLGMSMFIFRCPDDDGVLHEGVVCNPTVTLPEGRDRKLVAQEEGCLSLPGAYQSLARPDYAVCTGVDAFGQPVEIVGTGLLARCLQHETDHLGGTVFGDRLSGRSRRKLYQQHESLAHLYPADWPVTPRKTSATEL